MTDADLPPAPGGSAPRASAFPEHRRDPVTGRWAVVAPARAHRPMRAALPPPADSPADCPFCPGHEHDTPDEVYAVRDAAGWRLRVVANKYPAVEPDAPAGAGRHEVVIECREHVVRPADVSVEAHADLFRAYRDRLRAHAADPALAYTLAFKNVGPAAGASLAHAHSQLLATPFVPPLVQDELAAAAAHFARTGKCVFCELVAAERGGPRVVTESSDFVAVTAFAPRFAYEVWVLPKSHAARYGAAPDGQLDDLAGLVKRVAGALDAVLGPVAFNWYVHTAPHRSPELPHYHWHLEILPRTATPAGFEWGAGCHVTVTAPEAAAADLRRAMS